MGGNVPQVDADVERVRRAHLNDMENIYLFFPAALAYVLTNPDALIAIWLFRVYTASRIIHTLIYAVFPVPPPWRTIIYVIGVSITSFMTVWTIIIFAA